MNKNVLGLGLCLMSFLFLMTGCSSSRSAKNEGPKLGPTFMLYSPNGEPLNGSVLGRPTCKEALSYWFDRVDANHDDMISHDEFMADASAQFSRMDIDKNGYLLPEELERYRLPYRQDINPIPQDAGSASQDQKTKERHNGSSDDDNTGRANQSGQPDPVMSADTNNHFRVTSHEFKTQAEKIFNTLDIHHEDFLKREAVLKTCASKEKQSGSWFKF